MHIKLIILVLALSVLLCACSLKLKIGLINNTEEAVMIVSDEGISVSHGNIAIFFYPTLARQYRFQISLSDCTFTYEMPSTIESYSKLDGFDGEVIVQLEKDTRLYLVPPISRSVIVLSDAMVLQKEGFPVSPIEEHCQKDQEARRHENP